jgi:NAD+ synthase
LDLCLYAFNHGMNPADVAPAVGLTPEQVERVFRDIESKRKAARYGHLPPQLIEKTAHNTVKVQKNAKIENNYKI